jgi:predicted N-acyltransferase
VNGIRAIVVDRLDRIERDTWDALKRPSLYHSYDWLAARSHSVRGRLHLVLVLDAQGSPVMALPCFTTDALSHPRYDVAGILTEWSPDRSEAWHERLRPALVVATPTLTGGLLEAPGLDDSDRSDALSLIVDTVEEIAVAQAIPTIAWLYVAHDGDPQLHRELTARSYLSGVMEAECELPIIWKSSDEYLGHLKASGRRAVLKERAKLAEAGVSVCLSGQEALGHELAVLEAQWRRKYGRSDALAEIEQQYALLRCNGLARRLRLFVARSRGAAVGFAAFFEDDDVWYSRFLGFDYGAEVSDLYFNLLFHAPIEHAIARRIHLIRYSFESYDAKRRRGCILRPVLLHIRAPQDLRSRVATAVETLDQSRRAAFDRIAAAHSKQQ